MATTRLTTEEMTALAPYEQNFRTAVEQNWSRGLSRMAYETIYAIYKRIYGAKAARLNTACSICLMQLLKDVGRIYLDNLNAEPEPEPAPTPAPTPKKKTTKKATK